VIFGSGRRGRSESAGLANQEGPGLTDEAIAAADAHVAIRQFGSTRSINAAAAAAIVMHKWVRQHAPAS
jgi:tRNA G18 (ribose-2'-O)-methylase SpoU